MFHQGRDVIVDRQWNPNVRRPGYRNLRKSDFRNGVCAIRNRKIDIDFSRAEQFVQSSACTAVLEPVHIRQLVLAAGQCVTRVAVVTSLLQQDQERDTGVIRLLFACVCVLWVPFRNSRKTQGRPLSSSGQVFCCARSMTHLQSAMCL